MIRFEDVGRDYAFKSKKFNVRRPRRFVVKNKTKKFNRGLNINFETLKEKRRGMDEMKI